MLEALLIDEEKEQMVDLATFIRMRDERPELAKGHLFCPECRKAVHTHDEKGALGFRIVNLDVTRRIFANRRSAPGFHHYDHGAPLTCSRSLASDPRYKGIREFNEFSEEDRERNVKALMQPNARQAIADIQTFFMKSLTGLDTLLPEDKKILKQVEDRLLTMVGLADHIWIMGYVGPLVLGRRTRFLGGNYVTAEYITTGRQILKIKGMDGEERILRVPEKIVLCKSQTDSALPNPMRRGKKHGKRAMERIEFPVSRDFAWKVAKDALNRRRAAEAIRKTDLQAEADAPMKGPRHYPKPPSSQPAAAKRRLAAAQFRFKIA
ncbi:MAG: hypothetical protein P4M15_08850 [Alphaproteobacteria bacterium]|nr:hypothetical protein [Alphaproteobacteria bacterium]